MWLICGNYGYYVVTMVTVMLSDESADHVPAALSASSTYALQKLRVLRILLQQNLDHIMDK